MTKKYGKSFLFGTLALGALAIALAYFTRHEFFRPETEGRDALVRIRERGYLVVLTDRNTLNYFIQKGAVMGYQYDLATSFGEFLGVPVKILAANSIGQLYRYLDYHAGDILALNIPVTGDGRKLARLSEPIGETRLVVVMQKATRGGKGNPASLKEFPEDTVFVQANPFMASQVHAFYRKTGRHAVIREVTDTTSEELIRMVATGKIRYALVHENVAMVLHRSHPGLDISLLAFPLFSYGWALNRHSDSLQAKVNEWLEAQKHSGELKYTYLSYFQNDRINSYFRGDYFTVTGSRLSPFDESIRQASRIIGWDWRLVASLVYQESNFQTGLVSRRSASGLMQLMPETAAKFGVDSASTPARQIAAGVKYLRYIDQQLPAEITDPIERIYFILATYNIGIGRVMNAREKAEKYGRDKNRWNRHVDYYLLKRSKKDPNPEPDTTGMAPVDFNTEGFTDDVVTRYFHYRNLVK